MARKGNTPDKTDEKDTASKRRYQSPQTPPQAPRSRPQQGREQGRQKDQDFDSEDSGEGQEKARGTSQEPGAHAHDFDQQTQERGQKRGDQEQEQDWQDDAEADESFGSSQADGYAARGSDFDLQKASRDELNAIAQELNIEDYETMNREELVIEIRERS